MAKIAWKGVLGLIALLFFWRRAVSTHVHPVEGPSVAPLRKKAEKTHLSDLRKIKIEANEKWRKSIERLYPKVDEDRKPQILEASKHGEVTGFEHVSGDIIATIVTEDVHIVHYFWLDNWTEAKGPRKISSIYHQMIVDVWRKEDVTVTFQRLHSHTDYVEEDNEGKNWTETSFRGVGTLRIEGGEILFEFEGETKRYPLHD